MHTLQTITDIVSQNQSALADQFHVRRFGIFGSMAKGTATPNSDIDMLVEFTEPIGLFQFIALEQKLSHLLGTPIDLATPNALKATIRTKILHETVYV
jgi:uncharacterized protein